MSVQGTGGTGKTRLVVHYAWNTLGDWPGGVWFCDLPEAREVDGIAWAVARALGVPLGKQDPIASIGSAIAARGRCLVLLDNFEQVARFAAVTAGSWLNRAREARFLVTTREVLGLPGETTVALPPLPHADAVALFAARAPDSSLDLSADPSGTTLDALVDLLDRLPLAIELAASQARRTPIDAIVAGMSERFQLLSSAGGRHTRQATLRATLDWSWALLSAEEQDALAQISVFEGGFPLDAAEAVVVAANSWPVDLVQALADKSLLSTRDDGRCVLLASIQEYASEKLDLSADHRAAAEARHGTFYAAFGTDDALDALDAHGGVALSTSLAREFDNLVVACRRAVGRGDGAVAVATLRATWAVLELNGPYRDGVALAEAVLGLEGLDTGQRGLAGRVLGLAEYHSGRPDEARAHFEAALTAARGSVDRALEASLLSGLGMVHQVQARLDQAHGYYEAALALSREIGDRRFEGIFLANRGTANSRLGRFADARADYRAALAIHRAVGNRRSEGIVLGNLATIDLSLGEPAEAQAHGEAALVIHREVGNRVFEGIELGNLGLIYAEQGAQAQARTHYQAALQLYGSVGDRRSEGFVLGSLGLLDAAEGRTAEARAHLDRALGIHREAGNRRVEGVVRGDLGVLCADLNRLEEARAHFDAGEALLRASRDTVELSRLLCGRACLEQEADQREAARAALDEAEVLAGEVNAGPKSPLHRALERARHTLTGG